MSKGRMNSTCIISVMTRAGVPIVTVPETNSSSVFSLLVYSLVSISGHNNHGGMVRYEVKNRLLLIRILDKTIIAVYAPFSYEKQVEAFMLGIHERLHNINKLIVEEGMVDGQVIEETKVAVLSMARSCGLPIDGALNVFKRLCGDLYKEAIDRGVDGSVFKGLFRVAYFPTLIDTDILNKEPNGLAREILKMCDGCHSIRQIAETYGVGEAKLYRFIARLIRGGKMILELGYELI